MSEAGIDAKVLHLTGLMLSANGFRGIGRKGGITHDDDRMRVVEY
jgi:hypothetical protein